MNGDVIPYFCDRTRGVETKLKKINFYRKSWSRMTVSVYKTKIKKKKRDATFPSRAFYRESVRGRASSNH